MSAIDDLAVCSREALGHLGSAIRLARVSDVVHPFENDQPARARLPEDVTVQPRQRSRTQATAQYRVAADTRVEHRDVAGPRICQQAAGEVVRPAIVAIGSGAAAVGDRVAKRDYGRAIRLHIQSRQQVPVISGRGFGQIGCGHPVAGLQIGGSSRAGMSRQRSGRGTDLERDGEVAQGRHVIREGVGGRSSPCRDEQRVHAGERELAVSGGVDRRRAARTGDVRRRDGEWGITERVRAMQSNHGPADRDMKHLPQRAAGEPGRGRHVARLHELRRCGPSAEPVRRASGVNNWS